MKKIFRITAIAVGSLLLLVMLLPLLFKGKIVKLVKAEINNQLTARVDFRDVSVSLIRHFPKLSVALDDISVTGTGVFEKDTLLQAERLDVSLDLLSLFGSEMSVYAIFVESPKIRAIVNEEGLANWDISKPDTSISSTGSPSSFRLKLHKYQVTGGTVYYEDRQAGMKAELTGLDHEGSGNFTSDIFTLHTSTATTKASFTYDRIPYLAGVNMQLDADININTTESSYRFSRASIALNALQLQADGGIRIVNDSTYEMDITFNAPKNEFKDFLSLVPALYTKDFTELETKGTAALKGYVKGTYGPAQLPAYQVDVRIADGFFKYPDLPRPVKNIRVDARFSNPTGAPDDAIVDVRSAHLEMGADPFDFRMVYSNPESAKVIDAAIKGRINLSEISRFIRFDAGTKLSGLLEADAYAKGSMAAIQQRQGDFSAGGFFRIHDLFYASADLPVPVNNGRIDMRIQNEGGIADATVIDITSAHVELAQNPVDFTLKVREPVSAMKFSGTAKGSLDLGQLRHFYTPEPGTTLTGLLQADLSFSGSRAGIEQKKYDAITAQGNAHMRQVQYASKDYPEGISVSVLDMRFNPSDVTVQDLKAIYRGSNISANGTVKNIPGYMLHDQELAGSLFVAADRINLNDYLAADTAATPQAGASTEVFQVPAHVNLSLDARANEVNYDKVVYRNVKGTLLVKDETIWLKDVQSEALDGTMAFSGSYHTKTNKARPDISLTYDVKSVDVQKAFYAYNTFQKLMPAGKFLAGKLSSRFTMTGKLGSDMFPDLATLTGNGTLLLIEGFLSKFKPMEDIASTLQVSELKEVSLKDIRSQFEFSNGKVLVKPFQVKVKDIDMQVGGLHGIDQSVDYVVAMKIPRRYLGTQGNSLVNSLAQQSAAKGIPVNLGEMVDLKLSVGGSLLKPVIRTDLKQGASDVAADLKQQAAAFVQQKADSTRNVVKDSVKAVKDQVVGDVKDQLVKQLTLDRDSLSKPSFDSTKQKAGETLKKTFNNLLKKKQR